VPVSKQPTAAWQPDDTTPLRSVASAGPSQRPKGHLGGPEAAPGDTDLARAVEAWPRVREPICQAILKLTS
jgi:hypothetical protein